MPNSPLHGQVRSFRMPADFWLRRADRCREQNNPLRAVTLLRHAAQVDPHSTELTLEYALLLRSLCCYEASNRECLELLARRPAAFHAFGLLCQNYLSLGETALAMDAYSFYAQYARMCPDELPDWDEDMYEAEDRLFSPSAGQRYKRLNTLFKHAGQNLGRGKLNRAWKLLRRSAEKPFHKPMMQRDALLATYFFKKGNGKKARLYALRAVRAARAPTGILAPMALLLRELRSPAAAPALLLAAIRARSAEDETTVCLSALEARMEAVAAGLMERELKYAPHRASAVFNLCVLNLRRGELAACSAPIHRLREIDPEDPTIQRLFTVITDLEAAGADPKAVAAAGRKHFFYGMPDLVEHFMGAQALAASMADGVPAFVAALREDKRLYRRFVRLFGPSDSLYGLLPDICAAMEPEEAKALLRAVLLVNVKNGATLRLACRLLSERDVPPPYLTLCQDRLILFNPDEKPAPTPSFLQGLLFRRLREIAAQSDDPGVTAYGLAVIGRLPDEELFRFGRDAARAWNAALLAEYARLTGREPPPLLGALLSKKAQKEFKHARRIARRAVKQGGAPHEAH